MVTSWENCVKLFFPFLHNGREYRTQMRSSPVIRSDDLRHENRRRLLDTLRATGPCSPARLSSLTGLSAASISTLSTQLIDQGILLSQKDPDSVRKQVRGRPSTQLSLNAEAGYTIALKLTIDLIKVQRVDYAGQICQTHESTLDTRALSAQELLDTLCQSVERMCPPNRSNLLHHIGVAFQGMTEHTTGTLLWSPIIQHRNVPLGATLRERFGVPISVNNDCRLISEALSRDQQDVLGQSFATVLFSHGIGLGLYLGGRPFAGTRSSALEIGHLRYKHTGALCRCGKRGCIEAYSADYGIERLANGRPQEDAPTGRVSDTAIKTILGKALLGEEAAVNAFATAGAAVGEGLVSLFTLLDPLPVALVGRSIPAFNLMRGGIETTLKQNLGDDIDFTNLLHCYNNEDPLLDSGLIRNSLSQVDSLFSDPATDISISA